MPKRIILLSDGTGNSSASFWRTNVWRMFSALDLANNDQVACYDDGVGTSSLKPLALLGGAFGVGLRRNVISLYKFACRNFRSANDEIYAFGFSRGAFTIRVVIGLILDQGLIPADATSETELDRRARAAYRAYHKRHFHTNWGLIVKQIKKWFGKDPVEKSVMPSDRIIPTVRFLGLWDTVAAYGLPIDEMTRGVSQWLWPLEIPSHTLHPSVNWACHALSLDDERTTFHPVLWNERNENPQPGSPRFTKDERISSVVCWSPCKRRWRLSRRFTRADTAVLDSPGSEGLWLGLQSREPRGGGRDQGGAGQGRAAVRFAERIGKLLSLWPEANLAAMQRAFLENAE